MRRSRVQDDDPRASKVRSCTVYEIDGRLLVRTVDQSDRLGIERDDTATLDGFPDVDATEVGALVVEALNRTLEIPRPDSWPKLSEHAEPLLAASPRRYRSFRSWQRAARHVGVHAQADEITMTRSHPDLTRGSWVPAAEVGRPVGDWPQEITLAPSASPEDLGSAVLALLTQPSLRDG